MVELVLAVLFFLLSVGVIKAGGDISIFQALPNPTDENSEWIEVKNNTDHPVDISGYTLDDEADAGSKPYKFPAGTTLAPGSISRITKSQSGLILNNSKQKDQSYADEIILTDALGNQIDKLTYSTTSTDVPVSHILPPTPTSAPTTTPRPAATATPNPTPTYALVPTIAPTVSTSSMNLNVGTDTLPTSMPDTNGDTPSSRVLSLQDETHPQESLKIGPIAAIATGTALCGLGVYMRDRKSVV